MKACANCKETKSLSEFGKDCQKKDGLHSRCRKCVNIYSKERKQQHYDRALEYLGGACLCCGDLLERHLMEFHHVPGRGERSFGIGSSLHCKWETLKSELDKCQLLCVICHKDLHIEMRERAL